MSDVKILVNNHGSREPIFNGRLCEFWAALCLACMGIFCLLGLGACTRIAAVMPAPENSPTSEMAQLLMEPERWLEYTPDERFTMYNNILNFYDNVVESDTVIQGKRDSGKNHDNFVFSTQLQRLDDIFLAYMNTHPEDYYNSYYLYNIAGHYIERGEETMGLWLLRSMYQQFPDLKLTQYSSIHYLILDTLGRLEANLDYRIDDIQRILSHYDQQTALVNNYVVPRDDRGVWLYRLGKAYETKATEMLYINQDIYRQKLETAMDMYRHFFYLDAVTIPEEPNARSLVANKINIYDARRNWYTDSSLENLIRRITSAIQNNNAGAVLYCQANQFFVLSADYRDELSRNGTNIYLPHFLGGMIQFGDLTPESNDEEAWLYTTNWPFHLATWYLYFCKIHYPADPEIDGNWEWAGIYLGDFY